MRGKADKETLDKIYNRITPAYAGKSKVSWFFFLRSKDHPRVCGEKSMAVFWAAVVLGSPPRMRGKGEGFQLDIVEIGITPAYAGKRGKRKAMGRPLEDHPRVCGEKSPNGRKRPCVRGSPPRMRGKEEMERGAGKYWGITPAYAGKRATEVTRNFNKKDHPRVCGEKTKKIP